MFAVFYVFGCYDVPFLGLVVGGGFDLFWRASFCMFDDVFLFL